MSHGPSTFGTITTSSTIADLCDQCHQVVEHPGRLQRVHPRPQRRVAEVDLAPDRDQPGARGLLAIGRDRVLQIAQQDVRRSGHIRQPGEHLLVRGIEEMDHPRGGHGDLAQRRARRPPAARSRSEGCASPPSWRSMSPVDTDGPTREASARTPTAAISRSSRSARSTSTGRPRRSPRRTTTCSAC